MLTAITKEYPLSRELQEKIDLVLEAYGHDFSQIVNILLEVQDLNEKHYIPEPTAYYLAKKLEIPVARIYDCITFYGQLSEKPRAKYPIQVCNSPSCRVNALNTVQLLELLEELLGIKQGEITYDGLFTIETVSCYGACDRAPAVRINGTVYEHLDSREKLEALLRSLK